MSYSDRVHETESRSCWCGPSIIPATEEGRDGPCVVAHVEGVNAAGAIQRSERIREAYADIQREVAEAARG